MPEGLLPSILGQIGRATGAGRAQRNPDYDPNLPAGPGNMPYLASSLGSRFLGNDADDRNNSAADLTGRDFAAQRLAAVAPNINAAGGNTEQLTRNKGMMDVAGLNNTSEMDRINTINRNQIVRDSTLHRYEQGNMDMQYDLSARSDEQRARDARILKQLDGSPAEVEHLKASTDALKNSSRFQIFPENASIYDTMTGRLGATDKMKPGDGVVFKHTATEVAAKVAELEAARLAAAKKAVGDEPKAAKVPIAQALGEVIGPIGHHYAHPIDNTEDMIRAGYKGVKNRVTPIWSDFKKGFNK